MGGVVMPYRSNDELPPSVKNVLPAKAQEIFRSAFNTAVANGDSEELAFKKAWAAVKNAGFVKTETGEWKKQSMPRDKSFVVDLSELKLLDDAENADSEAPNALLPSFRLSTFKHPIYGEIKFDDNKLSQIINNFYSGIIGDDLPVNLSHDRHGGAVGWVKDLVRDGNNVIAKVWFNKRGLDVVKDKQYKYASIEFTDNFVDPETNKDFGTVLTGVALTNNPFIIRQNPVKLLSFDVNDYQYYVVDDDVNTFQFGGKYDMDEVNEEVMKEAVDQVNTDSITLSMEEFKKMEMERNNLLQATIKLQREMFMAKVDSLMAKAEVRLDDGKKLSPAIINWAKDVLGDKYFGNIMLENTDFRDDLYKQVEQLLLNVAPCTVPVESKTEVEHILTNESKDVTTSFNDDDIKRFWK